MLLWINIWIVTTIDFYTYHLFIVTNVRVNENILISKNEFFGANIIVFHMVMDFIE